jgi:pimeloyl-[acyl-carrier protein] methyl ester esterase
MERQIEIHSYHGWGFDAFFWDALHSHIPADIDVKAADRGYFGNNMQLAFESPKSTKILLLHSFGLHWCPRDEIIEADFVVLMNSFSSFLPTNSANDDREGKALRRMIKQFESAPSEVLGAFYKNCFYPNETTFNKLEVNVNYQLLLNDLKYLYNCSFEDFSTLQSKAIILNSTLDRIVPGTQADSLPRLMPQLPCKNFAGVGHALPIIKSEECWSFIKWAIPII